MQRPLLTVTDMSKTYGASRVLSAVTLGVESAEIVGLLGPNGAGKTTLIKIIGGSLPPDHGNMQLDGQAIDLANYSPRIAQALGVSSVQQELSLCTNLSVAENFFLTQPVRSRNWRRTSEATAKKALEEVFPNSGISVSAKVGSLTLAQRQMVEIARRRVSSRSEVAGLRRADFCVKSGPYRGLTQLPADSAPTRHRDNLRLAQVRGSARDCGPGNHSAWW